ncbi:D-aminoacylase [Salinibaculum salinum]|uniref:N-acyl-D-amino-acid deacylase family protein n=1 Tax=Salinibaculum salinum TaxID=3131996 RepID=UPI0030EB1A74
MTVSSDESLEFQHATVLDGSGRPAFTAHVLISGNEIRRIGDEPAGADREIDLGGSYLAPGFIDMHAHSDLRLLHTPGATEKLTQGITTEVLGQDGISVAPVPAALREQWEEHNESLNGSLDEPWPWNSVGEYLDELDAADPAVNCAYYVPHGNLRSLIAGFEDRSISGENVVVSGSNELVVSKSQWQGSDTDAAPGALGAVQNELAVALDEGAFGMSKGMIYPPSSYGRDQELEALAEVLGERDSFMISHVWNETNRVVESIDRYLDICDRGGCHAHVSHLKVGGQQNWGKSEQIVDLFDDAIERGQRVTFDQYPYTAGSTMLTALLPPWARKGKPRDIRTRLRDPETVEDITEDINSPSEWENLARAAGDWDNILITQTGSGESQGDTIADIATERDLDPVEAMCELLLEEDLAVTMADFIMSEEDIERFLADDRGTFCTDGIFGGKPHPRAIGAFARILDHYVDDRETLTPELTAYKAAGNPADILGLQDRGYVREGYVADLVVFDLSDVRENATYEDPLQLSDGFEYVLVGGEIAVRDGDPTGERNGTVLRSTEEWGGPNRPELDRQTASPSP